MQRITTATRAIDLFGIGKDGFKDGDLANGIAPTDLNAAWFNQLQEEVANVVEAAGIALNGAVRTQLLQALRGVGVFQTPPQFDTSTKAATMAAVQRALGNFSSSRQLLGATTLGVADMGQNIWSAGSGAYTVTLPPVGTVPTGSVLYFWSSNPNPVTIARGTTDNILVNSTAVTSIVLGQGDSLYLIASPTSGVWIAFGGSAQLGSAASFASVRGVNGYKRLPGGEILQWGTALTSNSADVPVTLPIAYPTAITAVTVAPNATGSGVFACVNTKSATSFNLAGWSANASRSSFNVDWHSVGY